MEVNIAPVVSTAAIDLVDEHVHHRIRTTRILNDSQTAKHDVPWKVTIKPT